MLIYPKKLFIIFLTSILLTCAPNKSEPSFVITQTDNGKLFKTTVGKYFEAVFDECRGCADVWKITQIDSTIIVFSGYCDVKSNACKGCVGGTETRTIGFNALSTGSSSLVFGYFNDTIRVTIEIQ